MTKRQRKKQAKRVKRHLDWIIDEVWRDSMNAVIDNASIAANPMYRMEVTAEHAIRVTVVNASQVYYSQVEDPNSWTVGDDTGFWDEGVSPSGYIREFPYPSGLGFARLSNGDQSRRDRFPQPYLPDGSGNPEYGEFIREMDGCIPRQQILIPDGYPPLAFYGHRLMTMRGNSLL